MDAFIYLQQAFATVFQPFNFLVLILATLAGVIMGVLPGLSATMAIALLAGLTFNLPTQAAIISLIAVYVGCISGGCQAAVLLNIPGTPSSAATALDGYPLAKQGKGGLAIFLSTTGSCLGTLISVLSVLTLTPVLTKLALKFTSWEFFLLAIFGIMICGTLSARGAVLKGWISGILGLLVAQIGYDSLDSVPRFTYGNMNLAATVPLIPVMIGLFGFPEIVRSFKVSELGDAYKVSAFEIVKGFKVVARNFIAVVRSAFLGVGVGVIPGVGEDVGGWLSYSTSKTLSKDPDSFGKGNMVGVLSSETGSNACIGGGLIPILSLAVPGSAPGAVLLAAFIMHGYRPGPLLATEAPEFVYQIGVYLILASITMWAWALGIARLTVRILIVDKKILMPIIFVLCVIGSYLINYNLFDIKVMFVFGIVGLALSSMGFPSAPFLLGVVLGPMADSNLRRALLLSDGSIMPAFQRPICLFFLAIIAFMIVSQTGLPGYLKKLVRRGK